MRRIALAVCIVSLAALLQLLYWDQLAPLTWLLLYPAVFVAAALTGIEGGMLAVVLGALVGRYWFMQPAHALAITGSNQAISIAVFLLTGAGFAAFTHLLQGQAARRAAADSDAKLGRLLEYAADAVFIVQSDGRYTYANRRACELLGYSRAELLALSVADLTPPEEAARASQGLAALFAQGRHTDEVLLRRKDGSAVRVEVHAILLPDGTAYAACRDITERHALQERLAASQHSVQLLMENAPTALAIFDTDMRYLAVSRRWMADYGMGLEDVIGRSHYDVFPDLRSDWRAVHQRALAGEVVKQDQDRFELQDGSVQWLRWEVRPWYRADGMVGGIVVFAEDVSDRVEAQIAQRLAEENQRTALQYSPNAIFFVDRRGRYSFANRRAEEMLGYTQQQLLTMGLQDTLAQPSVAAGMAAIARTEESEPQFIELELLRKDGRLLTAELSSVLLPSGVILAEVRDVTAMRRAEASARQLSQAIEQSPESIFITDLHGTIEYVNAAFVRRSGYSRSEALGQNPRFLQSGKTPASRYTALWQALTRGEAWSGELYNRSKDGRDYVEFAIITPLRQPDGRITHYVAVQEDITERKEVATRLQEQQELLELMGMMTHTGGWAFDPQTGQGTWTPECARIHDLPEDTPIDVASGIRYYVEEHRPLIERVVHDAITQAKPYDVEVEIISAQGVRKWVRTLGEAVLSEGRVVKVRGAMQDITMWKQLLTELESHRSHLEELVARRTADLTVAITAAEAASHAKSTFLANMSHEIRTPMNGVLGMAYLLRQSGVSAQQASLLDRIEASGRHLLAVINDVLDLSKIESGKLALETHVFSLADLVEDIVGITEVRRKRSEVGFYLDLLGAPEQLRGDRTRLAQALINLVANALKFTPAGSITLRCRTQEQTPEGYLLRFEVQDTGIGMSEEQQARVFHAFEQADNATTRLYGGSGLGLAITQRIAEMMGGSVGVCSALGKGSTFWLTARLGRGADEKARPDIEPQQHVAAPQPSAAAAEPAALATARPGARILVVDDDETNRELARILCSNAGLAVEVAENGLQALQAVQQQPFDLVLMDLQMPVMDGLQASRAIRKLPHRQRLPILSLSANAFDEDRQRCLAAGMNDFIAKPFRPAELYATLDKWLATAAAADPAG